MKTKTMTQNFEKFEKIKKEMESLEINDSIEKKFSRQNCKITYVNTGSSVEWQLTMQTVYNGVHYSITLVAELHSESVSENLQEIVHAIYREGEILDEDFTEIALGLCNELSGKKDIRVVVDALEFVMEDFEILMHWYQEFADNMEDD